MEEGPGRGQLAHLSSQQSKEMNSKEPGPRQTLLKQGLRDPLPPFGPHLPQFCSPAVHLEVDSQWIKSLVKSEAPPSNHFQKWPRTPRAFSTNVLGILQANQVGNQD